MIVSFARRNNKYEKSLLPVIDRRIEITNDVGNGRILQMRSVYNRTLKGKEESSYSTQKGDTKVDASEMNKSFIFGYRLLFILD